MYIQRYFKCYNRSIEHGFFYFSLYNEALDISYIQALMYLAIGTLFEGSGVMLTVIDHTCTNR